jgi:tetratricopeptide (TPR) repeat protein
MKKRGNWRNVSRHFHVKPWRRQSDGTLALYWRNLLVYALLFISFTWITASSAIYYFVKNNIGYTDVRFSQIAGLPWTLDSYRKAKGEFFIQNGLRAAEESKWRAAIDQLRLGLPSAPSHENARLTLARIYLMAGRNDLARSTLMDGISYHPNKIKYIRSVLTFLFEIHADNSIIDLTNNLLSKESQALDLRRILLTARFYAYFNRGMFNEALNSIKGTEIENSLQVQIVDARIAWERGLRESSLISLRDLHTRFPQDDDIYQILQHYLQEQQNYAEARRIALARQLAIPAQPDAYIDFILLCPDKEARVAAARDFARSFSGKSEAVMKLISAISRRGWNDLAWTLVAEIDPSNHRERLVAESLAIEADLANSDYMKALGSLQTWLRSDKVLSDSERSSLLALRGIAHYGVGAEAEAEADISQVLNSRLPPPSTLLQLSKYLLVLQKEDMASLILEKAISLDPFYQPAIVALLELKLNSQDLESALPLLTKLSSLRKPPTELIYNIIRALQSDRYLYHPHLRLIPNELSARFSQFSN